MRYEGFAKLAEAARAFGRYMTHPDCAPGQKHVVELAAGMRVEQDFARLLALQARKADAVMPGGAQTVLV